MMKAAVLLLFLLVMGSTSELYATDVAGRVVMTSAFLDQLAERERISGDSAMRGYWNEPNGVLPISPPVVNPASDLGVLLYREGAEEPGADPVATVNVLSGGLERGVVVIRPKSRINFVMKSPFDHELYSPEKHDFKPQIQSSNTFRPIDFYSAGIFEVKCRQFPSFQSWVVVEPAHGVVEVSRNGSFAVNGLDEGDYRVKVFFSGNWVYDERVRVEGRKQTLNIELKELPKVDGETLKNSKTDSNSDSNSEVESGVDES